MTTPAHSGRLPPAAWTDSPDLTTRCDAATADTAVHVQPFPGPRSHIRSASSSSAIQGASDAARRRALLTSDLPSSTHPSGNTTHDTAAASIFADDPLTTMEKMSPPGGVRGFFERNKGLAYVLLAQIFGVLMNVTTRLLEVEGNKGLGMHPFQILFVRMAITTVLSTSYMWYSKVPHFPLGLPEVRWLLVARGIGGFFGVFGMYYSLLYLPLADATVITFITPSLSCYVCAKLIAEPFTRMEQIGALISFVGVTLIARPTTFFSFKPNPPASSVGDNAGHAEPLNQKTVGVADLSSVTGPQRLTAILVALVGVVGSAMAFVAMRWIGKRASPLLSVNYFCVCVTIVSAVAMLVLPDVKFMLPSGSKEWAYLIFLGCCGFAMQFLLSAGLQHEKSSRATLMTYTQMLFALFFDKLVFGHNPSLTSVFGSLLIVSSAIYIALQKESAKQRAEEEKQREQEAAASGSNIELAVTRRRSSSRRDEELGLMDHTEDHEEHSDPLQGADRDVNTSSASR